MKCFQLHFPFRQSHTFNSYASNSFLKKNYSSLKNVNTTSWSKFYFKIFPISKSCHQFFFLHNTHDKTYSTQTNSFNQFQWGDMVLLRDLSNNNTYLTGPLKPNGKLHTHNGPIEHKSLIGLKPRTLVQTHLKRNFLVHFPSLEEYTVKMSRTATPIYPKDASTVIQLLDLHPDHFILEAGTGSGALSLYLSRCLTEGLGKLVSIELREKHSLQAQTWIQRYHRGTYVSRIDFKIGSLEQILQQPQFQSQYPFRSFHGAVLDLLNPWPFFTTLLPFLKIDANLVVYVPNITQAVQCMQFIHQHQCPLVLDKCLEIIERPWTIKLAKIKWPEKKEPEASKDLTLNPSLIDVTSAFDTSTFDSGANLNSNFQDETPKSPMEEKSTSSHSSINLKSDLEAPKQDDWICRPSHMPTGHTAFLMKFKVSA